MLSMINNFFKRNKKILTFTVFWVFLYFIFGDLSFAEDTEDFLDDEWNISEAWQTDLKNRLNALSIFLSFWLAFFTYLSTLFLSSDWYSWGLFWLNAVFKDIWIFVSNIVYFIFAFILIFIAFMNIIGRWWEKYELKKALPKLAIGILIVPFSWFFVNFILSVVSILSIAALNLPSNSFPGFWEAMNDVHIPEKCTIDYSQSTWSESKYFDCTWTWSLAVSDWSTLIFKTISTYTYEIIWLEKIPEVLSSCTGEWKTSCITTIWDLIVKLFFDVLFLVLYVVLIIALGLVLMIRWIYLWLYMMLSPLFWLMYFFDKSAGWWEFFDKFNIKQFFSLAMVPVYTMLALSFGLLFIYIIWKWIINNTTDSNNEVFTFSDNTITVSNVELEIKWPWFNTENINKFIDSSAKAWKWGLDIVWGLILRIMGIVFLWMSVMAALRSSEVTRAIIEPLHAFGGQVGGMLKTAPQMIPIFPGGQSMKSLQTAWSTVSSSLQTIQNKKWNEFADKYNPFSWPKSDLSRQYRDIWSEVKGSRDEILNQIYKLNELWDTKTIANDRLALEAYAKQLKLLANKDWFKSEHKDAALKLIDEIVSKWNWNPTFIQEAFSELDKYAISSDKSIIWWTIDVSKDEIDNHLWKSNSGNNNSSLDSNIQNNLTDLDSPSINVWWNRIEFIYDWWITWSKKLEWSSLFTDQTYKDIAKAVLSNSSIRNQYETNFHDDLKEEINRFIKDWELSIDWDWNWKLDS